MKIKNKKQKEKFTLKLPSFLTKEKDISTLKGIAIHTFLQYVNFNNAEKNLNFEINRLYEKGFIEKSQLKYLDKEKIKKFFNSYTYKLIKNANYIKREKKFLCEIDSKKIFKNIKNKKILIQGIVDCIIKKDNKLILIDYKTDEISEKSLISRYKFQLLIYRYALEKIFERPIEFTIIHSLFLNKSIFI